jgi:hypothetical protein
VRYVTEIVNLTLAGVRVMGVTSTESTFAISLNTPEIAPLKTCTEDVFPRT